MPIIKKLPQEVVSKIAAGEVVVNPASVVKELIENSLDAGASSIEVVIKNGGKSYIKVSDNGSGMSKEDILLAVQRFTTSKISTIEDIYSIYSYGFRGEALASIVEVSRTVITSCNGNAAYKLEVVGGKIAKISETHRDKGTTVEVYDVLYNIPARRKFLSSERVETRMVTEIIEKFMLIRPDVKFLFKVEDETVYNAHPGTLQDRFSIIFPEVKEFKPIDHDLSENVLISGVISSPQYVRKNRSGQVFFVNKRFVLDNLLNLALERGYGESITQGSHPYAVIFLDLSPDKIDVNIHPQKLQVKFSDPQMVYNKLARTIRENLRKFSSYNLVIGKKIDEGTFDQTTSNYQSYSENLLKNLTYNPGKQDMQVVSEASKIFQPVFLPEEKDFHLPAEYLIIRNRYIVFEDRDGLTVVDFHAAHERIIFEQLKERNFESVPLLLPIEIKISKSMLQLTQQMKNEFQELGFDFEVKENEDGSGSVILKQIPSILKVTDASDVFLEVLDEYRIPFEKPKGLTYVLASKSCKAAVKTGDKLSKDEVIKLIEEIKRKSLLTCPHGRPIMMKLTYSQLDSFFERI
ncbi:MAG: DNA mismatch repair endonuclease MutL [Fervidobacterium sp.]